MEAPSAVPPAQESPAMTITINSSNIEAIFGDVPAAVELPAQGAAREPALFSGVPTFSIFARRRRRRPGEARRGAVSRPRTAEEPARGARHAS